MSDAWFKEQIAPDGAAEDGCHPDEAQTIQDLPDPDLTSKATESAPPKDGFTWKGLPKFGHLWADVYK